MVIGGSRDLPNGLWLSKTGDHFNFDLGDGLDDEAIAFRLAANNDPAIRSLMSGSGTCRSSPARASGWSPGRR